MGKSLKWSKKAVQQFYEIADYLEESFSKKAADNFVDKVYEKLEVLQKYPTLGRKAPKFKTVRFILIDKNRRLYYRIHGKQLIVCSIFDTRQYSGDKYQ